MQYPIAKSLFFTDLVARIQEHQRLTNEDFRPLSRAQLGWSYKEGEWSILQCLDHLNQTHDYYMERIRGALPGESAATPPKRDEYAPSFWAGVYMRFAFNPRFSYPAPAYTRPAALPDIATLERFLENQQALLNLIEEAESLDLRVKRIPIKGIMRFSLGDCLKILVYHDGLHMHQAQGVLRRLAQAGG